MAIKVVLATLKYVTRKFIIFKREWSNVTDIKYKTLRKSHKIKYSSKENLMTSCDFPGMLSLSNVSWV